MTVTKAFTNMNQLQYYVINNVRKKRRALGTRSKSWREKRKKKTEFLMLNRVSTQRFSLARLRFDGALEVHLKY